MTSDLAPTNCTVTDVHFVASGNWDDGVIWWPRRLSERNEVCDFTDNTAQCLRLIFELVHIERHRMTSAVAHKLQTRSRTSRGLGKRVLKTVDNIVYNGANRANASVHYTTLHSH